MYLGNNLYTTLDGGINDSALALSVSAGEGAQFGTEITRLYGSEKFPYYLTIWSASYSSPSLDSGMEIVEVTARDTDDFTIVRGKRGTSASAHSSGDKVMLGNYADDLVWESLPAKEYVDTHADDEGTSSYFRIGDTQIVFVNETITVGANTTYADKAETFPVAFKAGTTPSVVIQANSNYSNTFGWAYALSITNTGFTMRAANKGTTNNAGSMLVSYVAIGVWQ